MSKQINIRVEEGDYQQLKQLAREVRLSLPRYILFVLAKTVLTQRGGETGNGRVEREPSVVSLR